MDRRAAARPRRARPVEQHRGDIAVRRRHTSGRGQLHSSRRSAAAAPPPTRAGRVVNAPDESTSQCWVALVRDPGGVLVAVGPVDQLQRAETIGRALAAGSKDWSPRAGAAAQPGRGGSAAARATVRPDTAGSAAMSARRREWSACSGPVVAPLPAPPEGCLRCRPSRRRMPRVSRGAYPPRSAPAAAHQSAPATATTAPGRGQTLMRRGLP